LMFLVDGFDVHVLYFNANNSQFWSSCFLFDGLNWWFWCSCFLCSRTIIHQFVPLLLDLMALVDGLDFMISI
jgi:hypothetical protein